jgi:hypothetical protein
MSGRLVGQVISASPMLQERGLSKNGFLALLAIAEKCAEKNMQASVPWIHLSRGLYGASKRTVERTVGELKNTGFVRVVKRGWANQHGDAQAPIYELCLPPLVAETNRELFAKSGELSAKSGELSAMQSGGLNGSTNGSTNGDARASAPAPTPSRCPKHVNDPDPPDCRACQKAREQAVAAKLAAEKERQRAIRQCRKRERCDDRGHRYEGDRQVRCDHQPDADAAVTPTSQPNPKERA